MSHKTESLVKSTAAGLIAGGLAFMTVKSICAHRHLHRMSAAKAFKTIGTLLDAF